MKQNIMREAPILLPVFTTSVPLDFPSEGTFAFNKKTKKQLEVTVRINEQQYFNMNFLNHGGYIMACCRWAHVLDFTENGLDHIQMIIKRHFQKKYPVISSLYGQHTDTAEDIHISTIGFEGNPKEWYISMRIYGERFDDLMHGNPLINVTFASAVGNLCMASVDVFKEIMKSDAKQPKVLLKELTGIDKIDKNFDFGNYLDARNPDTGEIISTAREDGKTSGVELPEEIEIPQNLDKYPTNTYFSYFMKSLNDMEFVIFCNALYFEIKGKMVDLKKCSFFSDDDLDDMEKNVASLGDKVINGEDASTERLLITSTLFLIFSKMHTPLIEEKFHVKESAEGKLALELDGYFKKLIWRKWNTSYLEERMRQENETMAQVEADKAIVKQKSDEWKSIMEEMSFNAFLVFHSKMNELMKTKKATLIKYAFLDSKMLDDHKHYWAGTYYWHNKKYDERQYVLFRKNTEIIVTVFYEGILRGTLYGNDARTKYALKIKGIIVELMNTDWSAVNDNVR